MTITFPFDVQELENSPKESFSEDKGAANVRTFKVPYADRWTFVTGMRRVQYPGMSAVLAESFDIQPYVPNPSGTIVNIDQDLTSHDYAQVAVKYNQIGDNSTKEEQPDGTYLSYRQAQQIEFQTIPTRGLVWESDSILVAPDAFATIPIPVTTHTLTWSEVATPPWNLLSEIKGKVNDAAYSIPIIGLNVAAEGLFFESSESTAKVSVSGDAEWELSITMIEKQITAYGGLSYGWNHQYRDEEGWDRPVDRSGNPTFELSSFSSIFTQV